MGKIHRNSHENQEEHHLYAIYDKEDDDVVKYGISCEPFGNDGLSDRVRKQLKIFNVLVGWTRFFAKIILRGIKGRKRAEEIENDHIEAYRKKHGRKPRGNLK